MTRKKERFSPPSPGRGAEDGPEMRPDDPGPTGDGQGPAPDRSEAPRGAEGELARLLEWDLQEEDELARLAGDRDSGPRLELLREAEAWLGGLRRDEPCPDSGELYDLAPGPGASPLPEEARARLQAHLERCGECRHFVAGLVESPPGLELLDPDGQDAHPLWPLAGSLPAAGGRPRSARHLPWRRLVMPLASAAAAGLLLWMSFDLARNGEGISWRPDESPLVRGEAAGTLLFPRGPLLAPEDGGLLAHLPVFEIQPQEGCERYRVVVRRTGGGAFDLGEVAFELNSASPVLTAEQALAEGHYTWEAWATLDGLDTPLGELEFRVVRDETLARELSDLAGPRQVRLLHERGFQSDARQRARDFPSSPAMRAYLERPERRP